MLLEICAPNLQSALAAQEAGAQRIELCCALDIGGLTPSPALIRASVAALSIPVHVLIRPREGHFQYSKQELDLMAADIEFCRETGAKGVVIGALDANNMPDATALKLLLSAAESMNVCFHRAFDFCPKPADALEALIELGFSHLLSSGHAPDAWQGRVLLQQLVGQAAGRMVVMPGAGIHAGNIVQLAQFTGATEFHCSAKSKVGPSNSSQHLPGLETQYWESQASLIREINESMQQFTR